MSSKKNIPVAQKAVRAFSASAEFSNVGIIIGEVVSKWVPNILTIFGGLFSYIVFIADPLIYFFRSLVRLTRVIGRTFFGIKFEEEKHGAHPFLTLANLASLSCFAVAIPMFFGLIIASPVAITLAWACAILGLSITAHFDYAYQAKKAEEKFRALKDHPDTTLPDERDKAEEDYKTARYAKYLFIALLIGLSFLLLCGSATAFAPAAIIPVLTLITQISGAFLAMIAVCRFINWTQKGKIPDDRLFILNTRPTLEECEKYKGRYICIPKTNRYYYVELNAELKPLGKEQIEALFNSNKLAQLKKYFPITKEQALNKLLLGEKCYSLKSNGKVELLAFEEITADKAKKLADNGQSCYVSSENKITKVVATNLTKLDDTKTYFIEPDFKSGNFFIKIDTTEETRKASGTTAYLESLMKAKDSSSIKDKTPEVAPLAPGSKVSRQSIYPSSENHPANIHNPPPPILVN